ncbi:hypothetical protein AWJ20_2329 [Sugiyamaella lignohabitans]|uniref:Uncharacterized protein n=1 Tax=Sugiyamaella lignohabitans TaxID=796027 RepID=A0A167F1Y6_9ASCO|nr:uncharacterized protein AWJ20_2329 [Sugiyamaella lignohabitans]ANB14722.1 hypothetical protein AWJ20_2329 [Sugiyamaella lignohabitans]
MSEQNPGQPSAELQRAYEANIRLSTQFYNADSQLSGDDRAKLANTFWNQSVWLPLGSIPFLIAGIQGPRIAARMGYLGKGKNAGRGLSVFTGLFGLILGSRISQGVVYNYGQSSLSQSPNAQTAFTILGQYPPQIGLAYYRRTARDASLAMPDPSTIDWRKNPSFPLNLAVHRSELPNASSRTPGRPGRPNEVQTSYPSIQSPKQTDNETSDSSPFDSEDNKENSEAGRGGQMSSWDRIRAANGNASRSDGTNGGGWDAIRRGDRPAPNRVNSDRGTFNDEPRIIPPPVSRIHPESELESQQEFDLEVERERLGQGVADDFSESEKKWQ